MVHELFQNWSDSDAKLFRGSLDGGRYTPVDVKAAAEEAKKLLNIEASGTNGYIIPLFTEDELAPTDEYVIYKPQRESIRWYDSGFGISGAERTTSCETVNNTKIGHRLRYWLPENRPDVEPTFDESELPPEQVSPIDELSDTELQSFFEDLEDLVYSEKEAARETNWETYNDLGIEEAIRRNRVSGPFLSVRQKHGKDAKPAFVFQMEDDEDTDRSINLRGDEGLFEGNICIADAESNSDEFPLEVELLKVGDTSVTIQPDWDSVSEQSVVETLLSSNKIELWLHELLNPVPYDRRLKAIRQVRNDKSKRELLTGKRSVKFSDNEYSILGTDIELDEYQKLALAWADNAEDIVCIHGPPGTGKTRTLTAYVKQAVSRGLSVLVTAHSNQAVDNLLVGDSTPRSPEEDTLHAIAQDPDESLTIARHGNNSRNRVVQKEYAGKATSSADVVAATTSGAANFDKNSFDVAVVDEATQASRPATAIVLNCAKKLVLAGDHKQLPPYCADESMQEEDMHISLFEYLLNRYGSEISILLQQQYRMNEEIAEFPNQAFYDGKLKTAEQNRRWTVSNLNPIIGIDIAGSERRATHGKSLYNTEEAEAAAKQVKRLVQKGVHPEDIGVISAYSGQIGKIGARVNQLDIDNPEKVTIDTVDSFQGGEREAIIVSFVRSNQDGHSGFLEFPEEGPRRLNVALTRARKRIVLIGNWETLGTVAPHRTPEQSCAHHYANLAEHLRNKERMLSAD
jgi:hypothetical protein